MLSIDHQAEQLPPAARAHYQAAWMTAWDELQAAASNLYRAAPGQPRNIAQAEYNAARRSFDSARARAYAEAVAMPTT